MYPDLSAEVLQRLQEFDTGEKGVDGGFAYPAHLRCLHEGQICFFDTTESAAAFLESLN